ncbi:MULTISPECIES: LysR family transcriptional regulator [Streptomyces]|uniref:LysR family transcriptional regulator n=1 Tax=Streptomyces albus TaxID=1888 RepID=A0A8H1L4L1_9ACTN|nr:MULTISPECIES: LysR family transcriptional regulator [Streptomyces]MDI6408325.1 LysR family transcriptional regulator [Streptomyces albus]TGG77297.1 LysR family transcriptional regulator [Streptomyces albus]UVN56599.1 LysR family transcriptional regulator [Streptomyces albus]GHJ22219.1 LysR family transcriptional regulator [Streptomyces albus]
MFDSRHIRTFHEVVRAGSYTAAARALGYTQPAITQQMKALERSVGTPLFVRVGRRMRLTEAGQTLARHAEVILDSISTAQQQMESLTRLRSGKVTVCAFPSASATLVPEALAALAVAHPGIRVGLREDEPPESLRRVVRGESDITLAFTYPGLREQVPEELVEIPLLEDQLTVLLPTGHPMARRRAVKLDELAGERWIAGCLRCRANFLHECAELGFAPEIAFSTDDNLVVQSLVAEGLGIAMVPGLVLSFLVHKKVTGRALDPASRRQVSAYVLREHLHVPATARVLDALREAAERRVGC